MNDDTPAEVMDRFWQRVDKRPDCWLWTGGRRKGRPIFYVSSERGYIYGRRFAWEINGGELDSKTLVKAACGVTLCVNPEHAVLVPRCQVGTQDIAAEKRCGGCKEMLPAHAFSRNRRTSTGLSSWCRSCVQEKARNYRLSDPDGWRENKLFVRYGITAEQYDALLAAHRGVCAVCERPNNQNDRRTGQHRRLHIDHDHATGKVRGLLCAKCNSALGHADDSPERLRAMALYLERST
jgi:hypothetical protein